MWFLSGERNCFPKGLQTISRLIPSIEPLLKLNYVPISNNPQISVVSQQRVISCFMKSQLWVQNFPGWRSLQVGSEIFSEKISKHPSTITMREEENLYVRRSNHYAIHLTVNCNWKMKEGVKRWREWEVQISTYKTNKSWGIMYSMEKSQYCGSVVRCQMAAGLTRWSLL